MADFLSFLRFAFCILGSSMGVMFIIIGVAHFQVPPQLASGVAVSVAAVVFVYAVTKIIYLD